MWRCSTHQIIELPIMFSPFFLALEIFGKFCHERALLLVKHSWKRSFLPPTHRIYSVLANPILQSAKRCSYQRFSVSEHLQIYNLAVNKTFITTVCKLIHSPRLLPNHNLPWSRVAGLFNYVLWTTGQNSRYTGCEHRIPGHSALHNLGVGDAKCDWILSWW